MMELRGGNNEISRHLDSTEDEHGLKSSVE